MLEKTHIKASAGKILELVENLKIGKTTVNSPTGDFFYDTWKIKEEFKNTELENLLNSIGDCGEARVIIMQPGEAYCAHSDIDDRYHLTLEAVNSFLIDLDNKEMHKLLVDDVLYTMDTGRIHTAANFGYKPRYQLVIRKLLKRKTLDNPIKFKCEVDNPPYNFRYRFDQTVSVFLNRANKKGLVTNFNKLNDKVFKIDVEKTIVNDFKKIIFDCGNVILTDETLL